MRTGLEKLSFDLKIIEEMAALMPAYVVSDGLFWNVPVVGMPQLTLGGYFMRERRLLALSDLLSGDEKMRLQTAVSTVAEAIAPHVVQFEKKANAEIFARLRQFSEYLKDLQREHEDAVAGYKTAVEARVMVTVLMEMLEKRPFQLDAQTIAPLNTVDSTLHRQWIPDDFVWDDEWIAAYPPKTYWWLYGRPL